MKLVAITGSIATGKSFVLEIFKELGVPTFNCDEELREIMNSDEVIIRQVKEKFPEAIVRAKLSREILGDIIFRDTLRREELEGILYPKLYFRRKEFIKEHSHAALIALEVPLLYEKRQEDDYDSVIVTTISRKIQQQRALERGISKDKLKAILSNQLPTSIKASKADYLINTQADKKMLREKIKLIISDHK